MKDLLLGGILGMVFGSIVGVMLGEMALILYCVIMSTNLADTAPIVRTLFFVFVGVCQVAGITLGVMFMKRS
jgi:hypothetical protein